MSDYKADILQRVAGPRYTFYPDWGTFAAQLEAEGVKFPDPPKPVVEVSDAAFRAFASGFRRSTACGLRAAFKVMLKEALASRLHGELPIYTIYRALTGEEWPRDGA